MLTVILALVVGLLLLLWSLFTIYLHYLHRKYAHIPCPKPFNFYLGHLKAVANHAVTQKLPLDMILLKWYEQCGPLFVMVLIHRVTVITFNSQDYKVMLMSKKAYKNHEAYEDLGFPLGSRFVGNGLVTQPHYDKWYPTRKHYDQCFTKRFLKSWIPEINGCVDQLVGRIEARADGKTPILMSEEFELTVVEVISKVITSNDAKGALSFAPELKGKGSNEWIQAIHNSLSAVKASLFNTNITHMVLHPFKDKTYKLALQTNRTIARSCIEHRMKTLGKGEESPNDILGRILQRTTTSEFEADGTFEDLLDDFITLVVAGIETTQSLLGFSLALLLQHPPVLARVQEEVAEVLDEREFVTAEDVEKLEYTLQVLNECLRLYPPVPNVQRKYSEDIVLSGYNIPKDTSLNVSIYGMSHLPEHFENPYMFDPSRFDPRKTRPDPFTYLPFARGHRTCIGKNLALIEARIIIARLVQKFRFRLPEDYKIELEAELTIQPKARLYCTAELV